MRVIGHRKQILLVRYEGLITRNVRFTYSRLIWLNLSSRQNGPLCIVGRLGRGRNESARGMMGWGKRGSSRLFSLFIVARALAIFVEMPSWNLCGWESDKTNLVGVRPWSRSVYLPFIGQIQRYTALTFFLTEHVSQNSYRGKQHEDDSHSKVNDPAVVLRLRHLVLNRQNLSMTYNEPNLLFHSKSQ